MSVEGQPIPVPKRLQKRLELYQATDPDRLSPRERRVQDEKLGFTDGKPKTNAEIARIFNVTRARIIYIDRKAVGKMRRDQQKRNAQR